MKYVKRAVTVEAWRASDLIAAMKNGDPMPLALREPIAAGHIIIGIGSIELSMEATKHDRLRVIPEDWLVLGTHGEFYPCSAVVFADVYDAA